MDELASGWNLPPGVFSSMIPGNSQEDIDWENAHERAVGDIVDICQCNQEECDFTRWRTCGSDNTDEPVFAGCTKNIVTVDCKIGLGDIGDCPYVQGRTEAYFSDRHIDPLE